MEMDNQSYERLKKDALEYTADERQAFIDDTGWEEGWMGKFTESNGDLSERGLNEIDAVLTRVFNEAHGIGEV